MELKTLFGPLRKWWWLVLVGTLIAGISSYIATRDLPSLYIARATLLVGRTFADPNPTGNEMGLSRQLAALYAEVAERQPVRDATKAALGLNKLPDYEAAAIPDSQLIEISVTDISPHRAQAVANELAHQLVLTSPASIQEEEEERQAFVRQQLGYLQVSITETQAQLASLQARLAELESAVEISETQAQIEALEAKLSTTQTTYATLLASTTEGATNTVSLIEAAELPGAPIGLGRNVLVGIAAILGFALATGTAHLLELLSDAVMGPEDVRAISDAPMLGAIEPYDTEGESGLVITSNPSSTTAQSFRVLGSAVQYASRGSQGRVILVTSPFPDEGKTAIVSNLAAVVAQDGNRVLLVDADLANPNLHRVFDVEQKSGLFEILDTAGSVGEWDYTEVVESKIIETDIEGLFLLPAGVQGNANPAAIAGLANRIRFFLPQLQPYYDYIVLDSPPALAAADALTLSVMADGVLLILEVGQSRRSDLAEVLDQFTRVQSNVMGIILNRYSSGRRVLYPRPRMAASSSPGEVAIQTDGKQAEVETTPT